MSPGRVESRFEITHPEYGLLGTEMSFEKAIVSCGYIFIRRTWDRENDTYLHVYDVMAHISRPQLWKVSIAGDEPEIVLLEHRTE